MNLPDRYRWEAEKKDGTVIESGGDMSDCVRFSLIPMAVGLPRHDIIGVQMQRRFGRGFIKGLGGGMKEYLHCLVCSGFRYYVSSLTGNALITPKDKEVYL